jgi:hypothetical protein
LPDDIKYCTAQTLEYLLKEFLAPLERHGPPSGEDLRELIKYLIAKNIFAEHQLRVAHERLTALGIIPPPHDMVMNCKEGEFLIRYQDFDPFNLDERLTPDEVKEDLLKGLGYKKTRTPDLESDREYLEWLAADLRRTWPQAAEHFYGSPAKGKRLWDLIESHAHLYERYDPKLAALYRMVKSQRKPGRKKKYPPN